MNRLKVILIIVFLIGIAHSIKAEILSNGGGDASSTNFQVTACIGETIIGLAGSASSSISCGFLAGPTEIEICSTDFYKDSIVNFKDYAIFSQHWGELCAEPSGCNCADLSDDGTVDYFDLRMFCEDWLKIEYVKFADFPLNQDPGWSTEGEWAFGQPSGGGGAYGNSDPMSGYTGDNVYGVNLAGDYSTSVGGPYYLTSGPIDCSGYYNIILEFARWLNTDVPEFVSSTIEVSNNGTDWSTVWQHTGTSPITDSDWQLMEYDISSTVDNQQTVYIRWGYEILDNHADEYSGWNIDDVQLWGNDFRLPEYNLDADPGWATEGEWAFGQPSGGGGAYGYPDPISGYIGDNVYGVNLTGDYSIIVGGPYYLTSGPIDCSRQHNIRLQFARWLNTDAPGYVTSKIEVSNNGFDWSIIWQGASVITDSDWQIIEYDISSVADYQKTVYVRWSYEIEDTHAFPYSGWNIDEIKILGEP